MAKSKEVVFSEIVFKKQKDAEDYVRMLLLDLEQCGFADSSSEHWPFLCELLERHPEYDAKRGSGILKFIIKRSAYGHIELNLQRTDGSPMDVSWKKCVTGRPTSILGNLKAAMRVKIDTQIESFKTANFHPEASCGICGVLLSDVKDTHADHFEHFETLAEKFIIDNPYYPQDFDDEAITNRAKFKNTDSTFAQKWFDFHKTNAKLRLVHPKCNLRRKKAI